VPSKNYTYLFTDGGPEKWAFIVVKNEKIIYEESGIFGLGVSTSNDDTESEAIFRAIQYAKEHPSNYILTTDSQAIIAKVNGNVANATKNPNIKGIQTLLKEFKESQLPISFSIKWEKRLSNEFMRRVDELCRCGLTTHHG
jgi:ribonuclease HI